MNTAVTETKKVARVDHAVFEMKFVDIGRQYLAYRDEIDARIRNVLEHTQFILGPEVEELEQVLSARVGVKHAVTTASGTVSLEIALRSLNIGLGDEVITSPFTFVATAEVIRLVGATPVFVDIDEDSFNVDPTAVELAITNRTKAIIAVNLFGRMADYSHLNKISDSQSVPLIEDAAQSFGAVQDGKVSGGAGFVGATSFFPAKTLSCFGDGGALFCSDDNLALRIRQLRNHGGDGSDFSYVGTNGRLDTLQAAIVLAKLIHFDDELERRRLLARRYSENLADICRVPALSVGDEHVFTPFTIRVRHRDQVRSELAKIDVPTAVYYPRCLHQQPAYAAFGKVGNFPIAEKAATEVLSLPLHPFLLEAEQDLVIREVRSAVKRLSGSP